MNTKPKSKKKKLLKCNVCGDKHVTMPYQNLTKDFCSKVCWEAYLFEEGFPIGITNEN